ncbi:MAG: hypothetical protein ISR97_01925 [Nitrospira sp.]|nr:hypothetical protein [Nitrospira sp.]
MEKETCVLDFTNELNEFIDLENSLMPRRRAIEETLERTVGKIIESARTDSCLSNCRLKDVSIIETGIYYQEYYDKLVKVRKKLENAVGQFVLIQDTDYQLFLDLEHPGHKYHDPFSIAAIGIIAEKPFQVGFEEETDESHFYLKLLFENGAYIRECKFNNNNKNRLFSKFQRLIPSQQGTRVYRKTVKELQYVQSETDFERSYENIQNHYLNKTGGQKSRKPYWKIAAGKFKSQNVLIDRNPVISVPDHHGNTEFAIHIGNKEVARRLGIDVSGIKSLDILYEMLQASRGNGSKKSLVL